MQISKCIYILLAMSALRVLQASDNTTEQKPLLIYEYASSAGLVNFNLKNIPSLHASNEYHLWIDISDLNIYAWIKQNSLKVDVDIHDNPIKEYIFIRETMPWPVTVENPQQYECYHKLLEIIGKDDYYKSADFQNQRTLQLYDLSKQLLMLWANKRNVRLQENGQPIELRLVNQPRQTKPEQIPVSNQLSARINQTEKAVNLENIQSTTALSTQKPVPQKPLNAWERWTSKKVWSNWLQVQKYKIYGFLGLSAAVGGGVGLWYLSQSKTGVSVSLPGFPRLVPSAIKKP